MFIRSKKIKGKEYFYLVESVREGGKVRQRIVRYLGCRRPHISEERMQLIKEEKEEEEIRKKILRYLPELAHDPEEVGRYVRIFRSLREMFVNDTDEKLIEYTRNWIKNRNFF